MMLINKEHMKASLSLIETSMEDNDVNKLGSHEDISIAMLMS